MAASQGIGLKEDLLLFLSPQSCLALCRRGAFAFPLQGRALGSLVGWV